MEICIGKLWRGWASPLSPPHFSQDNDVFLHWAPVEEAGDPTQILFSKKVGPPASHSPVFSRPEQ